MDTAHLKNWLVPKALPDICTAVFACEVCDITEERHGPQGEMEAWLADQYRDHGQCAREHVRFHAGDHLELSTLADDEVAVARAPDGWDIYRVPQGA